MYVDSGSQLGSNLTDYFLSIRDLCILAMLVARSSQLTTRMIEKKGDAECATMKLNKLTDKEYCRIAKGMATPYNRYVYGRYMQIEIVLGEIEQNIRRLYAIN